VELSRIGQEHRPYAFDWLRQLCRCGPVCLDGYRLRAVPTCLDGYRLRAGPACLISQSCLISLPCLLYLLALADLIEPASPAVGLVLACALIDLSSIVIPLVLPPYCTQRR
jgi:hypothetical protein